MDTFELHYEPRLIRRAVRGFVRWRLLGPGPLLGLAEGLLLGAAALLAASHDWGWVVALVGVAALPLLLALLGWGLHLRYKLRTLRAMGAPVAWLAVDADADALRFRSGAGQYVLPLATIVAWRERADFWLLLTAPNRFVILPTADLPTPVLAWLRARLAAIGRGR